MTGFDPSTFLSQRTSDDFTKRPPLPAGLEIIGVIGTELKTRQTQGKDDPSVTYNWLDIPIKLDLSSCPAIPARVREALGDSLTLTHGIRLDFTPSGALDSSPGKNGGLRQYREATKLTKEHGIVDFGITDLCGRIVKAKISHREYQGDIFDQIQSVTRP